MLSVSLFAAELIATAALFIHQSWEKRRNVLLYIRPKVTRLPIVDAKLRKMAGKPNRAQRLAAKAAVTSIRKLVNTQAFEHLVQAKINTNSPLARKSQIKPDIKLCI